MPKVSKYEKHLAGQLNFYGVPHQREVIFDPFNQWRADFLVDDLLIEVEGGTWSTESNRHGYGQGFEDDCVKYARAMLAGYRVLRVTGKMVRDGRAIGFILALTGRPTDPPSACGAGG